MIKCLAASLLLALAACHPNATVGTSSMVSVPSDSASTCSAYCDQIGLSLESVVIMANNVGCVCSNVATQTPPSMTPSASSAGGVTAVMMAEAAERQQQQATQQAAQQH